MLNLKHLELTLSDNFLGNNYKILKSLKECLKLPNLIFLSLDLSRNYL